jgi:hypothetical protein
VNAYLAIQISMLKVVKRSLRRVNQWLLRTPERALNEAYEAVLQIRRIEDEYFNGNRITMDNANYGDSTQRYFQTELKKNLEIARVRLIEFNASRSVLSISNQRVTEVQLGESPDDSLTVNVIDKPALILNKLRFIDEVLERYNPSKFNTQGRSPLVISAESQTVPTSDKARPTSSKYLNQKRTSSDWGQPYMSKSKSDDVESFADKTGVLPRSILRTVDRIKRELDPKAEDQVVETFRDSKIRTIVSLRFILILIIVPLLTQQISKNFIVGPIVDQMRSGQETSIFINSEMEEEAYQELSQFEERLRFQILIGRIPPMTDEEVREKIQEEADELGKEYHQRSSDAIKNVFSDILASLALAAVFIYSREEIQMLKMFIDELIYGLSDSAKAFIIILFTDTFVGFHSPHGWEILLEGVSRHFGLPANRDFIFLFIATFPVILDTVFKYWIFRYLNRISPSAVATYKNMNET